MEETDKKIHAISTPYGSPILKNIKEKARKDFIDKSVKSVSFLGLVTEKQYKKLLELNMSQIDAYTKLMDKIKTDLAYADMTIEEMQETQNMLVDKLTNYEIMTNMYQYLKSIKVDISYEDFIFCMSNQMDDLDLLEALMTKAKELKFGKDEGLGVAENSAKKGEMVSVNTDKEDDGLDVMQKVIKKAGEEYSKWLDGQLAEALGIK
jgi:hypothetical protein